MILLGSRTILIVLACASMLIAGCKGEGLGVVDTGPGIDLRFQDGPARDGARPPDRGGDGPLGEGCLRETCFELGLQCGSVSDGCGGTLSCGTCTPPESCGGGGTPNICGCTPMTCTAAGKNCGTMPDGCGGKVDCGTCPAGQACGATSPNVCGSGSCTPTTCADQGKNCGFVSDGCADVLDCGTCTPPEECGGGGTAYVCGCTLTTCEVAGKNCGKVADGCGGELDCGACKPPNTCGGGGEENVCGCTPTTCAAEGKNCGTIADGCGGELDCGSCTAPEECGGGGTANVCGCDPISCADENCGKMPDGCNGTVDCGTCPPDEECGGGGKPNVCAPGVCEPTTCEAEGKDCDQISDGCGGLLPSCGDCTAPEECGGGGTANVCGCTPTTCPKEGKDCGTIPNGCETGTLSCGTCTLPEVCGGAGTKNVCAVPPPKLRNGFQQSDGKKSWSQDCDIDATGAPDCALASHPFSTWTLPPAGITPDAGQHISGRYVFVYTASGAKKLRNGFVQSDGKKFWSQTCDISAIGAVNCDAATHAFSTWGAPTAFTPDAGQHISDRYAFVYRANGAQKLRNGFVQSDGKKAWSQTCDISAAGVLDCDSSTHPFSTWPLPPVEITVDAGQHISHRYNFVYTVSGAQKLRNGFVQSDGKKAWSHTCDISASGAHDCTVATHPFSTWTLPPSGITPDAGQYIADRYVFVH